MSTPAKSTPAARSEALATRLNSIAIHLVRRLRRADEALGVPPARLSALSVLVFGGACTLGELADREQVSAPTMTRIVTGLEQQGLARREPDARDRRLVRVVATAKGRRVMKRGRDLRVARLAKELRALGGEELEALESAAVILEALEQTGQRQALGPSGAAQSTGLQRNSPR